MNRFLFDFLTKSVCSHKYLEPNKLRMLVVNDRMSGNLLLSSHWSSMSSSIIRVHGETGEGKGNLSFSITVPEAIVKFDRNRSDSCCITLHLGTDVVLRETVNEGECRAPFGSKGLDVSV